LIHALIDALLGATGSPDIGSLFKNTDSRWKDAASTDFLKIVWKKLQAERWSVLNIDATVLAEAPRLAPHLSRMKKVLGSILGLRPGCIGIKATTAEKLGFIGRKEGVLASAVVLLQRWPSSHT
jgi:2-C-methyl-D-erythritol 2,4-cyclodiphosphate synthase